VPWAIAAFIPYIAIYGALDGNLGWWPGGPGCSLAWAVLLGIGGALVCTLALRAPELPAWAWPAALATCCIGPLIDFDLHAAGYLGTALAVACIAPGAWRSARGLPSRVLPLLAALALLALIIGAAAVGRRLTEAEELIALARSAGSEPEALRAIALRCDAGADAAPGALVEAAADRAWALADGAPRLRLAALQLMPASSMATARAEELARSAPHSASVLLHLAERQLAEHRWSEAAGSAIAAVACSPTAPRVLMAAASVLDIAAQQPAQADRAVRAAELRREAARLNPLVDGRMRSSTGGQ
jgi:hypothetical protein